MGNPLFGGIGENGGNNLFGPFGGVMQFMNQFNQLSNLANQIIPFIRR